MRGCVGNRLVMKVGSREWEQAKGPPLTIPQRLAVLAGAGRVLLAHLVARWGRPPKVDLSPWAPPDSAVAQEAEALMREASTPPMANHAIRTYWFAAVMYELSPAKPPIDREVLYVAALLHDVGFREPRPQGDGCFSVSSAREARRVTASWTEDRRDRVAAAIVTNPTPSVPLSMGAEAHFMSRGGTVEVLGQRWKVHPANVAEILTKAPREGFPQDGAAHLRREAHLHPGSRFGCLSPILPFMVGRSTF
jgi:hypothetical protein